MIQLPENTVTIILVIALLVLAYNYYNCSKQAKMNEGFRFRFKCNPFKYYDQNGVLFDPIHT